MNRLKRNSIFNNNLKIIEQCDNLLYQEVIKCDLDASEIQKVASEIAVDGTTIMKVMYNEYEWYLNSKYEPIQVAKQWVEQLGKIESIATIAMFGLSNGLLLKEMMSKSSEFVIFMIYEPSIEVFLKAMQEIDFSFLDDRVFIMVEGVNDFYLEDYFEAFINYENLSVCKFISHPNYYSCFLHEGKQYLARLTTAIKYIEINKNARLVLSEGYFKNTLFNMKYLSQVSVIDQIENVVGNQIPKELPAIIVSAGPSLSKNIMELKKAKGKSFIIATDSAMVGLLNEGIIPDVLASIDPVKPMNRFEDERIETIPMISPESARFELMQKHKDKKIFVNNTFGFGNLFYEKLGMTYKPWSFGGSVATFSFSIAKIMGFQTIILVGQDLAFTNNTRYYDKVKDWSDHDTLPKGMFVEVEDIHGGKVKTSKDLATYIEWFENQIKNSKELETIDATEGGAKIHGSKIMDLSVAIKEKCKVEFDMVQYLRDIPICLGEKENRELIQLIKELPDYYNSLLEDASSGIDLYSKLISKLEEQKEKVKLSELVQKISKVTEKIESNLIYFHVQHKIQKVEYTVMNNLGVSSENETEDALQVAMRGKIILEAIKQVLEDEVLDEINQVVEHIK